MGEFGDKFRTAREEKGFSLDDVANVTKIGSRMLQAIEQEHFDQLPGGVFNKGFIRAYAKHLGLNAEEAVSDYLACLRQAQVEAQAVVWQPPSAAPPPRPAVQAPSQPAVKEQAPPPAAELPDLQLPRAEDVRRPRRNFPTLRASSIPWRIVVVGAIVVILGIVLWSRHSRAPRAESTSIVPATSRPPASSPAPASSTTPPSSQTAANLPPGPVATTNTAMPSTPAVAPTSNNNVAKKSADSDTDSASDEEDTVAKPLAPVPALKPAAPLTLVIRAAETSWIFVTADGQTVAEETLIAPAHTSIRASREIVVKVGNAGGVSFLWNGKEISAQGSESEVKTLVFDANGMRLVPTPQAPTAN